MTGKRNSAEEIANNQSKTRLKWTEAMNTKLLECKREAKDLVQSKDPPRKEDGKKQGYMAIMKQLWDNSEFADLNISTQNLRDQAARIEQSLGSAGATIREESNTANDLLQPNVDNQETSSEDLEQDNYEFADTTQVKANRIDATVIDKTSKQVRVIEMSCPWLEIRESEDFEKTTKYSQLRLELTNRYPEYKVNQYNIIMDVLGGCSKEVEKKIKELVGDKCESIMRQMQKAILSS